MVCLHIGVCVCVHLCGLTWNARVTLDFLDISVIVTLKLCLTFKFSVDLSRLLPRRCCRIRVIALSVHSRSCMYKREVRSSRVCVGALLYGFFCDNNLPQTRLCGFNHCKSPCGEHTSDELMFTLSARSAGSCKDSLNSPV